MTDDSTGLFAALGLDPEHDVELQQAIRDEDDYQRLITSMAATRDCLGLSQPEVADAMGTKQSAVSRLESGLQDARYSTLQRYARAVGGRFVSRLVFDGPVTATLRVPTVGAELTHEGQHTVALRIERHA